MSYYDPTLTPESPEGLASGLGESPYPFNDIADVEPAAPVLGDWPTYPRQRSLDAEPQPEMDTHNNTDFPMHRSGLIGPAKPGSF